MMMTEKKKRVRANLFMFEIGSDDLEHALDRAVERLQARNPDRRVTRAEVLRRLIRAADKNPKILD